MRGGRPTERFDVVLMMSRGFSLLTTAFPDLRDAFDADELPIAFILERDFRRSERWLPPYTNPPSGQQRPDHSTSSHAGPAS
jgi:hypothetical protein